MLNIRLKPEQETYLNNFIENKSEYVRELIKEDMKDENNEFSMKAFVKCKKNFLKFMSQHAPHLGIDSVRRYDEEIGHYFDKNEHVFINKGRMLGISSIFAACGVWEAVFNAGSEVLMVSVNGDNAKMLMKKVKHIYKGTVPSEMFPDITASSLRKLELKNGSEIKAVSTHEKMKSSADLVILDEMNQMGPLVDITLYGAKTQVLASTTGIREDNNNHEMMVSMSEPESEFKYLEIPSTTSKERDSEWVKEQKDLLGEEQYENEHTTPRET